MAVMIYFYVIGCEDKATTWSRRYFKHAHFMPIVGVGRRVGVYKLVQGEDLPKHHSFGTTLRFTVCFVGQKRMYLKIIAAESVVGRI